MKLTVSLFLFLLSISFCILADEPDSAYVFSYATNKQNNTAGLHYAWSIDQKSWHSIGSEWRFLFSDFGRWGTQKKLISPFLIQDNNGSWHCIWSLNDEVGQFAHASTRDLYTWRRQSYPYVMEAGNARMIEVSFDASHENYIITWLSDVDGAEKVFKTTTSDFKNYSATVEALENDRLGLRSELEIDGEKQIGVINKVSWDMVDGLIRQHQWSQFHELQRAEKMKDDPERFKSLKDIEATISLKPDEQKKISDLLVGIFFEDINYGADGGLYAELVQNRGFEYALSDREGKDLSWNSYKAWSCTGSKNCFTIDTVRPVHPNQKHYAVLEIEEQGGGLINEGFDGIPVKAGEKYNFSVFARTIDGAKGSLKIALVDQENQYYGEALIPEISSEWEKYETAITAKATINDVRLMLIPEKTAALALDMISLFPEKTFRGHKNGLRADLAQAIADIHPRFVRFPGGCVAHGDGLKNMYRWKNTVGELESRKPQRNIWGYHQTAGLGYFEYFQFCEDLGAEPVPVLPAGVPCQNSATCGHGQQGGIPMCEMDDYVQEVLDLIEWANGDKNTKWGKVRAEAGHPEPFNLKYIGIGNEDLITDIFEERFTMIFKAVKEKHPEIVVIGTVGPTYMGTDYEEGWELASKLGVPMVDEHYYQPPGWFIHNQDFYDKYDRSKSKVYLGEYAAHLPGRPNNLETALAEALYLAALERNGDIVEMTSYAPLLAKEKHTQWNPDLIYFNNTEVKPTVNYHVQRLFGQNSGETYIPTTIKLSNDRDDIKKRVAMSAVYDSQRKNLILKLVNLLPAAVNSKIDLTGYQVAELEAVLTVLTGSPEDEQAIPEESKISIGESIDYQLPAYSFSVVRIKTE